MIVGNLVAHGRYVNASLFMWHKIYFNICRSLAALFAIAAQNRPTIFAFNRDQRSTIWIDMDIGEAVDNRIMFSPSRPWGPSDDPRSGGS